MSVTFTIEGLADVREALRHLPETLVGEASHLIEARGNQATVAIKAQYPSGSDLQAQTTVRLERDAVSTYAIVTNPNPVAHLYDSGSVARQYVTYRGVPHRTGRMPAKHVFAGVMPRLRRALHADLAALLQRQGLEVHNDER